MIKLHVSMWDLLFHGAAMYLVTVFMLRGHLLRRRLLAVAR
jgi:hypothetical protein